jgi:16S rRNA C967 or C1407 C5-methylase (RsmB/RsmF family)
MEKDFIEIVNSYDFIPNKQRIIESINKPKDIYFRVNVIKDSEEKILKALKRYNIDYTKVDFIDGYYKLNSNNNQLIELSKTVEHLFGFIYIQEISSAISIDTLFKTIYDKIFNRDKLIIVDLCASPGGKSILIADRLYKNDKKLFKNLVLISNDIGQRIENLLTNIIRLGVLNVIVTNCDARFFPKLNENVDIVIADVPCSSESHIIDKMYYSSKNHPKFINRITNIQKDILLRAYSISNNYIVYSTCTFNLHENEEIVDNLLFKTKNVCILKPVLGKANFEKGVVKYNEITFNKELEKTVRIYPYHYNSGGIFFSILSKNDPYESLSNTVSFANLIDVKEVNEFFIVNNKVIFDNYLSHFGIDFNIVNDYTFFQKIKDKRRDNLTDLLKEDIYITLLKSYLDKEKGPLKVEAFGIKAFRYVKPINSFKITSNLLSIFSKYITKNYVSLKFDLKLLIDFLLRKKIELKSEYFEEIDIGSHPYVAVKFNDLVIGCALNYKDYIISEIPTNKANFFISALTKKSNHLSFYIADTIY